MPRLAARVDTASPRGIASSPGSPGSPANRRDPLTSWHRVLTFDPGRTLTVVDMDGYSISQVAERTGFPPSTLRFYEQAGLVRPARTPAGYRCYDDNHI